MRLMTAISCHASQDTCHFPYPKHSGTHVNRMTKWYSPYLLFASANGKYLLYNSKCPYNLRCHQFVPVCLPSVLSPHLGSFSNHQMISYLWNPFLSFLHSKMFVNVSHVLGPVLSSRKIRWINTSFQKLPFQTLHKQSIRKRILSEYTYHLLQIKFLIR